MAEIPERCLYCLGEPDHAHKPTNACGNCCSMHGCRYGAPDLDMVKDLCVYEDAQ